jgi:hypothetical protein
MCEQEEYEKQQGIIARIRSVIGTALSSKPIVTDVGSREWDVFVRVDLDFDDDDYERYQRVESFGYQTSINVNDVGHGMKFLNHFLRMTDNLTNNLTNDDQRFPGVDGPILQAIVLMFGKILLNNYIQLGTGVDYHGEFPTCTFDIRRLFTESLSQSNGWSVYLIEMPNIAVRNYFGSEIRLLKDLDPLVLEYLGDEDEDFPSCNVDFDGVLDECGFNIEHQGQVVQTWAPGSGSGSGSGSKIGSKIEKILVPGTDPRSRNRFYNPVLVYSVE